MVVQKKKSIFRQEHYWIGVAAGAALMFVIMQFKKKRA
jgi:hypothetical protein|tara:strand:+ start:1447 stop:1560 length:114 start_codon:yes stop_codon:yes gene_type:complete